eukprot:7814-Heterococcus_DN1.PRE.1
MGKRINTIQAAVRQRKLSCHGSSATFIICLIGHCRAIRSAIDSNAAASRCLIDSRASRATERTPMVMVYGVSFPRKISALGQTPPTLGGVRSSKVPMYFLRSP